MTSWPDRLVVVPSSSLDDDAQGAQFLDLGSQTGPSLK